MNHGLAKRMNVTTVFNAIFASLSEENLAHQSRKLAGVKHPPKSLSSYMNKKEKKPKRIGSSTTQSTPILLAVCHVHPLLPFHKAVRVVIPCFE